MVFVETWSWSSQEFKKEISKDKDYGNEFDNHQIEKILSAGIISSDNMKTTGEPTAKLRPALAKWIFDS